MENLERLVRTLCKHPTETSWVEFKRAYFNWERIGALLSGLANAAALEGRRCAYLIWGVEDATHEIVGVDQDFPTVKDKNEELENWLRQRLSRNADFFYQSVIIDQKKVGVVTVMAAIKYPVAFSRNEYFRSGSITRPLNEFEGLRNRLLEKLHDARYEEGVALPDCEPHNILALLDVAEYFRRIGIPYPSSQENLLRYLTIEGILSHQDDGLLAITNLGALLFARSLSAFRRVARKKLRIICYSDGTRQEISQSSELEGGYAVIFEEAMRLIRALTPGKEPIIDGVRTIQPAYPEVPVREALANMLIHQDFTETGTGPLLEIFPERIEFSNPGASLVALDRIIDSPPKSRNELLAALMRRLHLCEEAGSGWDRIVIGCEAESLPPPKILNYETGTRLIFFVQRAYANWSLDERLRACYQHACRRHLLGGTLTNQSLRERFGVMDSTAGSVSRVIAEAVRRKMIKPSDETASKRYMRYVPYWA